MTINYNAPHFILAAIQRIYPDLPNLVGADWATIKPRVDAHIAKLEATPNDSITSMRLVSLLAEYEPANQRFAAEIKIQEDTSQNIAKPMPDIARNRGFARLAACLTLIARALRNKLPGTSRTFDTGSGSLASISPGDDEGRGIGQVIHDVAPDASLAFYTGDLGQADFAQGIRDLAAVNASVIADDISYLDEPMYQVGIIGNELETYYESFLRMSTAEAYTELSEITMKYQHGDHPYANPYFWAAFTFNGV